MGKKVQETRVFPGSVEQYAALLRAVGTTGFGITFRSETPLQNGVRFDLSGGYTMRSWGEDIAVTLVALESGTQVDILSKCVMPTQLMDAGKNAENIRNLFAYLASVPLQSAAQSARYCPACGKPLPPEGAHFCPACGAKCE